MTPICCRRDRPPCLELAVGQLSPRMRWPSCWRPAYSATAPLPSRPATLSSSGCLTATNPSCRCDHSSSHRPDQGAFAPNRPLMRFMCWFTSCRQARQAVCMWMACVWAMRISTVKDCCSTLVQAYSPAGKYRGSINLDKGASKGYTFLYNTQARTDLHACVAVFRWWCRCVACSHRCCGAHRYDDGRPSC